MTTAPLFDRIRSEARSTAERKVASVLLEGYPTRALSTVEVLAKQASVSAPTVLRFLAKIGFSRFADFQAAAIADVERQLGSPLNNIRDDMAADTSDHIYQRTLLLQAEALQVAAAQAMPAEFDAIVDLLVNPRAPVKVLGGRYSQNLAQRLAVHLGQLRPGVSFVPLLLGFAYDPLVDAGAQDVYVIFDYRRYQAELLHFARGARQSGARICLLTDTWRSPIAEYADAVLTSPDASTSPFGSRVVATAQIEAIVAAVSLRTRDQSRKRLARIEELRKLGDPDVPSSKE
ncbi:MurR/RpiR family transcriptional regulator [Sinirhodobacter populi]|uniref:MurR/RpiR family transcriptional regulator n=1 Tax=Paenirhodobacter populi TaxID=2306993 RepID=A0A443K594_9RHOB|nr:MurR/RpiR family transcriptional regulator [Sinirhodobacter populi]RWR27920.1 MurR/RpiR family transcriptional regulator [Sinirhodobacter populi]